MNKKEIADTLRLPDLKYKTKTDILLNQRNAKEKEFLYKLAVISLRLTKPGKIKTHAVCVEGVLYPVKKAWAHITGTDVLDFNTNQARSWFKQIGFEVIRK